MLALLRSIAFEVVNHDERLQLRARFAVILAASWSSLARRLVFIFLFFRLFCGAQTKSFDKPSPYFLKKASFWLCLVNFDFLTILTWWLYGILIDGVLVVGREVHTLSNVVPGGFRLPELPDRLFSTLTRLVFRPLLFWFKYFLSLKSRWGSWVIRAVITWLVTFLCPSIPLFLAPWRRSRQRDCIFHMESIFIVAWQFFWFGWVLALLIFLRHGPTLLWRFSRLRTVR